MISNSGRFTLDNYQGGTMIPPPLVGGVLTQSGSLHFDGQAGFLSFRYKSNLDKVPGGVESCVRVDFPKGVLPSPDFVQAQLSQAEPMAAQAMAKAPHTDITVGGEVLHLYPVVAPPNNQQVGCAGVRANGVPVGFAGKAECSESAWDPALRFTSWTHGAGDMAESPCDGPSAAELVKNPDALKVLEGFDQVMMALKSTAPLSHAVAHLPQQPSSIFKSAAQLVAGDIDWSLLTDYKAEYHFDPTKYKTVLPGASSAEAHGTIQVDFVGERLMISNSGRFTLDNYQGGTMIPPPLVGGVLTQSGSLHFDGQAGFLSFRYKSNLDKVPGGVESCVRVDFPKGVLPSPDFVQAQLSQAEPMAEQAMANAPHTDITVDGEVLHPYPAVGPQNQQAGCTGVRSNGIPVGF